jgi:Polyketide cyclase / dehydrase and lipid transport
MEGEGIGALRRATFDGSTVVERLEELDEASWRTSYSMPSRGPMPLADYYSTIQLESVAESRCLVRWTTRFEPVGVSQKEAEETVRWAHGLVIDALQQRFGDGAGGAA